MKRKMLDTVDAALNRFDDEPELIELAPGDTSLDFLLRVYRSVKQPMSRRMRAAIEAMPHEHPRLGAVAVGYLSGDDFASRLDRAIERSSKINLIGLNQPRPADGAPIGASDPAKQKYD
jgi:hypothetical protein